VCLGSALELALFCHARICGKGSVLGLPESGFGLVPGCGGIQMIQALAGRSRALELILSGSSFTAEEAFAWKIVDKIVAKKDIVDSAVKLIKNAGRHYNRSGISSRIPKNW
jgi:enoyl-CoA hydratase/carnithine racemase